MEHRNSRYNAVGTIDLDYNHPSHGWIPFTASPDDPEQLGRDLYALALQGEVAPYVIPEHPAVPTSVTPAQAKIALYEAGLLDDVEALVADYPYRPVNIWWTSALSFHRDHAYLNAIGIELGLTDERIDELFITAGKR